ncbi:hypothetical protein [Sphingobium indicum]|uniref:hypothetical protein n=1 Tax=Sphingobium indicum TaxID=332055 RepID=UPI001F4126DB|nr:hypothetical protein [Sphingobium indicum]
MKKSDRAKKHTGKVIEAAARAHEALDYFNGNVTNPFDELTWPSIAEGYLLVAQKAVSDALVALEGRVPSHGVTASALGPAAKGAKRPELQAPTVAWLFA